MQVNKPGSCEKTTPFCKPFFVIIGIYISITGIGLKLIGIRDKEGKAAGIPGKKERESFLTMIGNGRPYRPDQQFYRKICGKFTENIRKICRHFKEMWIDNLADILWTICGHLTENLRTFSGHFIEMHIDNPADILWTICGHLTENLRTSYIEILQRLYGQFPRIYMGFVVQTSSKMFPELR